MSKPEDRLIEGFLNNSITVEEARSVIEWLTSAEGQIYYKERFCEEERKATYGEVFLTDHEIRSQLIFERISKAISHVGYERKLNRLTWLKIAATILLPLLVLNSILWLKNKKLADKPLTWQEVYVPKGEKLQVMFQDGTKVWLNSDTRLRYPVAFDNKNRKVELTGEAYFTVQKDPDRPFIVQLNDFDIRVTGTSFNVKSYKDDEIITATLDEGKIRLELKETNNRKEYSIYPGQEAIYSKKGGNVDIALAIPGQGSAWKKNRLEFKDTPLTEVVSTLERWYNIKIIIRDKDIEQYAYTINYENEPLENVLKGIERITPVQCVQNDSIVSIFRKQ